MVSRRTVFSGLRGRYTALEDLYLEERIAKLDGINYKMPL